MKPSKKFIKADACKWLFKNKGLGAVITSPPDAEEINKSIDDWRNWFLMAVELCFNATKKDTPTIFYVTDRKHNNELISKTNLIFQGANNLNRKLMFHKIALRKPVNSIELHRPSYSHLLAFNNINKAYPTTIQGADVFERGKVLYNNGMGLSAAILSVKYAGLFTDTIVNPFSGQGTICTIAETYGLNSIGIELLNEQIEKSKGITISK
tara:strand:- start:13015 stop:13644 length:630 start_codon:yes stop_codon:yes gene_type:complete